MVIVHVETKVVPEKEADYVAAMTDLMAMTKAESGNITYHFSKHMEEDYCYLVTEVWESWDAFEFHEATDHFKNYIKRSMDENFAQRPPLMIKFEGEISAG
ncbi:MAG: antibiotic biosynthesis monooxygenase [Turicibacter sp.]|nr:antibiotic biosynthesis monooxygenase [Turicibacter sp.]